MKEINELCIHELIDLNIKIVNRVKLL